MAWGCVRAGLWPDLILQTQGFLQAKIVFNPCCHPEELCVQAVGKKTAKKEEFYFIAFENSKY